MLEAVLIPRIRKCTPKSFPTPISQQAKTYWPFILNNVLLLFITQKNISCETMRHVMVWCCAYNVWYDYSLYTNILPRQVLLYLIYHERVHSYCVSRVKVMGAERREAGAEAERERHPPGLRMCSPELYCALQHYTVQYTAGYRAWGVSDRELARPETRGCHLSCLQTLSVALRSPDLGKCDSVCDKLWQIVTVWHVSRRTQRFF